MIDDRFKCRYFYKPSGKYINPPNLVYNNGSYDQLSIRQNTNGIFESYIITSWNTSDIIPEQCTGLKDKNGKLIYESDIVLKRDVSAIGYSRTRVSKVHWHNDWLSWAITTQYGDTYELSEFEPQQYEIIGNIHENADLLENEE